MNQGHPKIGLATYPPLCHKHSYKYPSAQQPTGSKDTHARTIVVPTPALGKTCPLPESPSPPSGPPCARPRQKPQRHRGGSNNDQTTTTRASYGRSHHLGIAVLDNNHFHTGTRPHATQAIGNNQARNTCPPTTLPYAHPQAQYTPPPQPTITTNTDKNHCPKYPRPWPPQLPSDPSATVKPWACSKPTRAPDNSTQECRKAGTRAHNDNTAPTQDWQRPKADPHTKKDQP